jgi:hypothetical protein
MASTSRAPRKTVEDAEIFRVLEESTDSDVTIFSSEEDEDSNEPDSDDDGQLDDNCETNKKGGTRAVALQEQTEKTSQQNLGNQLS